MKIIFAHGMESSPEGTKAVYLKENFGAISPWLGELNLNQQVDALQKTIPPDEKSIVVGSSMGALAALGLALESPGRIQHMLLLAPAVGFDRHAADRDAINEKRPGLFEQSVEIGSKAIPAEVPATIIHGLEDEVINLEDVVRFASRSPSARLILVHDDHSLHGSGDLIISVIENLLAGGDILCGI